MQNKLNYSEGYYLGVDIGSRNLKLVVINIDKQIIYKISSSYGSMHLQSKTTLLKKMMENIYGQFPNNINAIVSTGTGYSIAESCGIWNHITEVEANLIAARKLYPIARTIFEIGGTDAKCMEMSTGMHRLNNRCSSSTGISLENLASEIDMSMDQMAEEALKSTSPLYFDAICSVFARQDAIAQIQAGKSIQDVIMGYIDSMVDNFLHLAPNPRKPILFQGGVALNKAVVKSFRHKLMMDDTNFIVPQDPLFMVAHGAAISALQSKLNETTQQNIKHAISKIPKNNRHGLPLSLAKMRIKLFSDMEGFESNKGVEAESLTINAKNIVNNTNKIRKTIAWLGNLVPPEIMIALGFRPVWPAREAARSGNTKFANDLLRNASQHGFTQDCCSIQRLIIGLNNQ